MTDSEDKAGPEIEYERWSLQIRRGALSLAILAIILDGESYGYDIMKKLGHEDYDALQLEPSTTYPLLRRLESSWRPHTTRIAGMLTVSCHCFLSIFYDVMKYHSCNNFIKG